MTKAFDVDVVVIGAGVIGLACAARIARDGSSVFVLESNDVVGASTSSRNSEVIHAGMYYPTGSLKHVLCVEGRRRLYPYLDERRVAYRKCGKLIVATSGEETSKIEEIYQRGCSNEVEGLSLISASRAKAMEPALSCEAAILSEETGIFDSHGFMLALQGELEDAGGSVAFRTRFVSATPLASGGFEIRVHPDAVMTARAIVNSAGLQAQAVARRIEGLEVRHIPGLCMAKGSYFACRGRSVFSRLIYPAPVDGGLGVHVTLDLAGRMRFGPDVEWIDADDPGGVNLNVDATRAEAFAGHVRRYWPSLPDDAFLPDYAGLRPKLSGPGEPAADFRIDDEATHGLPDLINLFGIESPGLTSSLAIAERVAGSLC
jgi:L-2-hydroxyglutarate oxidase LhgO